MAARARGRVGGEVDGASASVRADFEPVGSGQMRCRYCGGLWSATTHSRLMHVRSRAHVKARGLALGLAAEDGAPLLRRAGTALPAGAVQRARQLERWERAREEAAERACAWLRGVKRGTRREAALALGVTDDAAAKALAELVRRGEARVGVRTAARGNGQASVRVWEVAHGAAQR